MEKENQKIITNSICRLMDFKRGKWICSMNGVNSVSFVSKINTRNDNLLVLRGTRMAPLLGRGGRRAVSGGNYQVHVGSSELQTKPLMPSARILEGWALRAFTVHTHLTRHHRDLTSLTRDLEPGVNYC